MHGRQVYDDLFQHNPSASVLERHVSPVGTETDMIDGRHEAQNPAIYLPSSLRRPRPISFPTPLLFQI
jgi:hypothetical protein